MIIELMEVLVIFILMVFEYKAWEYFCNFSNINPNEVIDFIGDLIREIY